MKSLLQILLFFLLTTQIHYPQWTNQNPVPDGNDLWSTFFVNDNTGWIVGSNGFIKKTTNAGVGWIQQNSGTTLTLKSVQFVDQNTGWICGESGLILKTTDGGVNWYSLASGTTQHLTDINFCDLDTGYVVGFSGTILKTTNGGSSWTSQSSGPSYDLTSVDFVDALLGYAVAQATMDSICILKTIDGGINWINKLFASGSYGDVHTVEFINADTGVVGGGHSIDNFFIFKTTDGGDTWVKTMSHRRQQETNKGEQLSIYSAGGVNSIFFKDSNIGYAVSGWGGWNRGIYTTTDGGSTWHRKYYGDEEDGLLSVYGNSAGKGWAVGRHGVIFITEDDGNSWAQILSGSNSVHLYSGDFIYSVFMINENVGWAGGIRNKVSQSLKSIILKTTNGGKIWKTQLPQGTVLSESKLVGATPVRCIYFINEDIGWAASDDRIYWTTDGGVNWMDSYVGVSLTINQIYFIDNNTGWKIDDKIYKTTDGGTSWIEKNSTSGNAICFSDINNGWICGPSGLIMRSTDSGETWNNQSSGTSADLNCIRFYDNNIGMCAGNGIKLITTNGGTNWNIKTSQYNLDFIQYINSVTVMINGFLYTTDGGNSWEPLSNGYHFTNKNIGWDWDGNDIFRYSEEPVPPINHFTKVWSGNPYLAMNLYITSATIDGVDLGAGDEIGIFDGGNCVGSVLLTEPIPSGGYIQVIASTDDPVTPGIDGFTPGDTITYKLWDSNNLNEIDRITPTYTTGSGKFASQGTAVVELDGIYTLTEYIGLTSGWNMLSIMATPDDPDMLQLLDPLITAEVLIKAQNETGNAVEKLPPPIGWINNIGNWQPKEGYYVKITPNSAATLSVTGPPVSLPLDIPLTNGWNIMSYPVPTPQNALVVLQPLITAGQLVKVQNEKGNAVEQLPPPIGWINKIGNFQSGEGYYIKVNTNTSLTMDKPVLIIFAGGEDWQFEKNGFSKVMADHFIPVWINNPFNAMNIYVTGVQLTGGGSLVAGDEIAVFDGQYCVGAVLLSEPIPSGGYVQIIASTDDPGTPVIDGFINGHTINYKFWLSASSEEITDYIVNYTSGNGTFASFGTAVVAFTNVLPVELVSFTADVKDNKVQLNWQTATEINNYGFEIERTVNEKEWTKIGFVEGNGNSNSPKSYLFTDDSPLGGSKFQYRLKQIDTDGKFEYSNEIEVEIVPTVFAIYQNYPNPFNPTTKIRYQLPKESKVVIKIYDILGAEVITLLNEKKDPGTYEVELNATSLSSGTYIYRIVAGEFVETKKMVLLR